MSKTAVVKDKFIQFKIDGDTKQKFMDHCEVNSINASDLLRKFIEEIIKKDSK